MSKLVRFDWAIKHLLRNKANFDILEGFLSELLKTKIKIDQILESESNKNHVEDKFNRVDLLAVTGSGEHVIIEVQCATQWDYLSRILYGSSKVICENLREGDQYSNLPKIISVSIVFFNLGEGKDYLYHGMTVFKGMHYNDTLSLNSHEKEMYGQLTSQDCQSPEAIFPEFYIIKVIAFQQQSKDKFDEWVYFLKHGKIESNFSAQGIQSAAKKLDVLQLSEQERRAYECYKEALHDEASFNAQVNIMREQSRVEGRMEGRMEGRVEGRVEGRMEGMAEGRVEGRMEGMAEGMVKGMEEGIAKGIEQGIEEGEARGITKGKKKTQLQIAKSLKHAGLSDIEIATHTKLSLEEIKALDD